MSNSISPGRTLLVHVTVNADYDVIRAAISAGPDHRRRSHRGTLLQYALQKINSNSYDIRVEGCSTERSYFFQQINGTFWRNLRWIVIQTVIFILNVAVFDKDTYNAIILKYKRSFQNNLISAILTDVLVLLDEKLFRELLA